LNTDEGKKIAPDFSCHLRAHLNFTLLVGWFVSVGNERKMILFFRTVENSAGDFVNLKHIHGKLSKQTLFHLISLL